MKERLSSPSEQAPEQLEGARQAALEQPRKAHRLSAAPEVFYESDLPNIRLGVEAKNNKGRTIWLTRLIARKIYNCAKCRHQIKLGEEHSLVRIQSGTHIDDHHHLHKPCSYTWINFEKPYSTFKDNTQNDRSINKRQARSRANRRRRNTKGVS